MKKFEKTFIGKGKQIGDLQIVRCQYKFPGQKTYKERNNTDCKTVLKRWFKD